MTPSAPYTNDSLRWVAAEVRYPPLSESPGALPELRERLRDEFPVLEEETQLAISMGSGGASAQRLPRHRFVRRDRLISVTIDRESITLEATDYGGWTRFSGIMIGALHALEQSKLPDGIVRVGLRYIDEIRLPEPPQTTTAWAGWVDDRLIAPFGLDDQASVANGTIVLQYGQAPGYVTVFRAAPFPMGRTVQLTGPLRMPVQTPEGPYFLLDTDASWADPNREVPEFASGTIAAILNDLHAPCVRLFEASITSRLRDDVLTLPREEAPAS